MKLDYKDNEIYATGNIEELRLLSSIQGALPAGNWIALPATRSNILACEVCGPVEEATDAYTAARSEALSPPRSRVYDALDRVRAISVNPDQLLPHQLAAVVQFHDQRAAYLAADMGLGKTRIALILARLWGARRVLLICPKGVVGQWEAEQRALWPKEQDRAIVEHLDQGSLEQRRKALCDCSSADWRQRRVLFGVNYEAVAALAPSLSEWGPDLLIIDESWRCKNPRAQVTKAVTALTQVWRARGTLKGVIELAGTPWGNDVGDIHTQLRILDPNLAPETHFQFLQSFAVLEQQRVRRGQVVVKPVGLRDPVGLIRRLEPVWFRASKETCLDLPPKTRRKVELALPRETQKLYRAVKKDGLAALGDDLALDGAREVAVRLQQLAGGHRPVPSGYGQGYEMFPIHSPKIDWIREFAESVLASDPSARCLVWCQFRAEIERVTELLQWILGTGRVAVCYGGIPDKELAAAKASYQSRRPDGVQVLVCQYQKMAAGYDLYATSHAIYFSPTWSHLLRSQSEDRGHRIGNQTGVQLIDLIAKSTIDEAVYACLARKEDFSARLLISTIGGK